MHLLIVMKCVNSPDMDSCILDFAFHHCHTHKKDKQTYFDLAVHTLTYEHIDCPGKHHIQGGALRARRQGKKVFGFLVLVEVLQKQRQGFDSNYYCLKHSYRYCTLKKKVHRL